MITLTAFALMASANFIVDPSRVQGTWEGWGTSLCWMGNPFGERKDIADFLFSTKTAHVGGLSVPGLGMSVVRYNAGACSPSVVDGRKMVLSKNVLPFRQIEGIWLDGRSADPNSTSWNWNADLGQRTMMLNAKKRGANRFELFSNSPMWWMCANDNPSGAARATADNLRPDMHQAFAVYLATIAKEAKKRWGVEFTSVEPFNEPASDYWSATGRQEGCHFSPATQAKFLPVLRAELDRQGLKAMPIASSDETSFDQALSTWKALPSTAKNLIDRVNVHGYHHSVGSRESYTTAISSKPRWNSEHGDGDASGLSTARELSEDLNVLKPSVWCYWQPLDGGGWGLLDCDMPTATVRKANPKLYVLAQYMRHIRPGMQILTSDDSNTVIGFDPVAHRLALVSVNIGPSTSKTFDLSAFKLGRTKASVWLTEPKGTTRYQKMADVSLMGSRLRAELAADSITTFEVATDK